MYGILMLLPQSAAFAALKNRLNSVSAIGYLHVPQPVPPRQSVGSASAVSTPATTPITTSFERGAGRLKAKEDGPVKWSELLERFKQVQERGRRMSRNNSILEEDQSARPTMEPNASSGQFGVTERRLMGPASVDHMQRSKTTPAIPNDTAGAKGSAGVPGALRSGSPNPAVPEKEKKSRFSAARFNKFTGGTKKGEQKKRE